MLHHHIIISPMPKGATRKWNINTAQARELQEELSGKIIGFNDSLKPKYIAGIDVSASRFSSIGQAAIAVLSYPGLELIDLAVAKDEIKYPYIPGLLSFREMPLILQAWERLNILPDLIIMDGQGIAHPRRLGIASHIGLVLDIPSIGCAKSRLIGEHDSPPEKAGNYSLLTDNGDIIGAVLRTRYSVKPLYISVGHKISLEQSISFILNCCRGFRLPEPIRFAHSKAGNKDKLPA
jgi:deoxyribonuclease V